MCLSGICERFVTTFHFVILVCRKNQSKIEVACFEEAESWQLAALAVIFAFHELAAMAGKRLIASSFSYVFVAA